MALSIARSNCALICGPFGGQVGDLLGAAGAGRGYLPFQAAQLEVELLGFESRRQGWLSLGSDGELGDDGGERRVVPGEVVDRGCEVVLEVGGRAAGAVGGEVLVEVDLAQRLATEVGQRDAQRKERALGALGLAERRGRRRPPLWGPGVVARPPPTTGTGSTLLPRRARRAATPRAPPRGRAGRRRAARALRA